MPNLYNQSHKHYWELTGKRGPHGTVHYCEYVKCQTCGQNGFRIPPRPGAFRANGPDSPGVIYTWSKDDPPEGIDS